MVYLQKGTLKILVKLMSMEPPQAYRCAISKIFSDTLSEMAPNISDIEQKTRTMSEKKKENTESGSFVLPLQFFCIDEQLFSE